MCTVQGMRMYKMQQAGSDAGLLSYQVGAAGCSKRVAVTIASPGRFAVCAVAMCGTLPLIRDMDDTGPAHDDSL
jgi:hypothetical protein